MLFAEAKKLRETFRPHTEVQVEEELARVKRLVLGNVELVLVPGRRHVREVEKDGRDFL